MCVGGGWGGWDGVGVKVRVRQQAGSEWVEKEAALIFNLTPG